MKFYLLTVILPLLMEALVACLVGTPTSFPQEEEEDANFSSEEEEEDPSSSSERAFLSTTATSSRSTLETRQGSEPVKVRGGRASAGRSSA